MGGVRFSSDSAGDFWQICTAANFPITQHLELTLFPGLNVCLPVWLTAHSIEPWHFDPAYRLWDIDTIINKALVYGGLSLLLAAVYLGLIVGLESLLGLVSGQASQPVVIVVSTLVIAALFQPLRHRVQAIIDRRFYRHKYDAARTLAAFSATLQNEVDLSQLSEHLLAVVQETMQPASVSLWLRPPDQERRPGPHQLPQLNGVPGKEETWGDTA